MNIQNTLEKKSEIVISSFTVGKHKKLLSETNMRLFNSLLVSFQDSPSNDFEFNLSDLVKNNLINDSSKEELTNQISELMSLNLTINYLRHHDEAYIKKYGKTDGNRLIKLLSQDVSFINVFEVCTLYDNVNDNKVIQKKLKIKFTNTFLSLLEDKMLFYIKLNLDTINKLSKYSARLYEILATLAPNSKHLENNVSKPKEVTIGIKELKELMGVSSSQAYKGNSSFIHNFLLFKLEELSKLPHGGTLTIAKTVGFEKGFKINKDGKYITSITILLNINMHSHDPKNLSKSKISRIRTRKEKLQFDLMKSQKSKLVADEKIKFLQKELAQI